MGLLALLLAAGPAAGGEGPAIALFGPPEPLPLAGYDGDAMEPFLARDGAVLLFNDSNAPGRNTMLHWAAREPDGSFGYRGPVTGVDSPALEAVGSLDGAGMLYLTSTRSYGETLATLYRGPFAAGSVALLERVPGPIDPARRGEVNMDAEISADGRELFISRAVMRMPLPFPAASDLLLARAEGAGFVLHPQSEELLREVNSEALEYAPATRADGLELYFTRARHLLWAAIGMAPDFKIMMARRPAIGAPFGPPRPLAGLTGFIEAPTVSADGMRLIYHRKAGGRFVLEQAARRCDAPGLPACER